MTYRITDTDTVIRLADNAFIPADPANMDYLAYQAWLAEGNTPEPVPQPTAEEQAASIRAERDQKLKQSDWIATKHLESGLMVPQEWLDYRQALRDITTQDGFPENVIWPTEPEG